jgi:multiple inositol-polyphosphate phosphatase/2,3-bisphosphoglycerate 3-phosphatase
VGTDPGRTWQSARVAPLGANLALVLYRRDGAAAGLEGHLVRLLYNEQVVPAPGCGPELDCPLARFLEVVVGDRAGEDVLRRVCGREEVASLLEPDLHEVS